VEWGGGRGDEGVPPHLTDACCTAVEHTRVGQHPLQLNHGRRNLQQQQWQQWQQQQQWQGELQESVCVQVANQTHNQLPVVLQYGL